MEPRLLSACRRAELDRFGVACRTMPELAGMVHNLFEHLLPQTAGEQEGKAQTLDDLLDEYGFDRQQHENIRPICEWGGLTAQNRLTPSSKIEDVRPQDVFEATGTLDERYTRTGLEALRAGSVVMCRWPAGWVPLD
jgi:hypothetical protein